MELQIAGEIVERGAIDCEVTLSVKNLSAARHTVEERGSDFEVTGINVDPNENILAVIPVFMTNHSLEPGESRKDTVLIRLPIKKEDIFRLRLHLHVESQGIDWDELEMVRLQDEH
jgi:hypothetical protein